MNKKRVQFLFGFIFLSLISLQFVSAFGYFDMRTEVNRLINLVVEFGEPFLQVTLGGDYWDGQMLFEKFLLFAILVGIVYIATSKAPFFIKDGEPMKGVIWTISLIIPILAVRYIDASWLNSILFTYAAFGIAMTTLIPLIIYFFFLQGLGDNFPGALVKISWILFICAYLGLWSTTSRDNYSQWYLFTAIVALLFMLFDGTIRRAIIKSKMKQLGLARREDFEREIRRQINQADTDLTTRVISPEQHLRIKRRLQEQLRALLKN